MDQSTLKSLLDYEPDTGVFRWRIDSGTRARIGAIAGCKHNGYRRLRWGGKGYLMHRLAFLYMTGEMPEYVDHINNVRHDNRWSNLRACDFSDNTRNAKRRIDNSTGIKGVTLRANGKFRVRIRVDGKRVHLGDFNSIEQASAAYAAASKEAHGEFSRLS